MVVKNSTRRASTTPRAATTIRNEVNLDAKRFAEYDADGNQALDFEEFLAMMPDRVRSNHSSEEIQQWFKMADTSGDGTISVNEFFVWSLSNAAIKHGGTALRGAFEKYDRDGSGVLDAREFAAAATEMGFGTHAHEIFTVLDKDGSGCLSYSELADLLKANVPSDPATKQMITSLAWSTDVAQKAERSILDTSKWRISATDAESVQRELRTLLQQSGGHVADLLKLFDQDNTNEMRIDDLEFFTAMREQCGFRGPKGVIDKVFASLDLDHSGYISFDELFEFVRGRRHSLDARNKRLRGLRLEPPPNLLVTLDEIHWDAETLRILLKQMIERGRCGPQDLMKLWDTSGDRHLSVKEFLTKVREVLDNQALWDSTVREVALSAFAQADAGHRNELGGSLIRDAIDLVELQQWLVPPARKEVRQKYRRDVAKVGKVALVAGRSFDSTQGGGETASGQPKSRQRSPIPNVGSTSPRNTSPMSLPPDAVQLRMAALSPRRLRHHAERGYLIRSANQLRRPLAITSLLDSLDQLQPRYYPFLDKMDQLAGWCMHTHPHAFSPPRVAAPARGIRSSHSNLV